MRLSARVLFFVGKTIPLVISLCVLLFLYVTVPPHTSIANAQDYSAKPMNTNPDVPDDQHSYTQTVMIETMSALICQLAGIDVIHSEKGCLGLDPKTNKIGYAPKTEGQQIGGLLGMNTSIASALYTQPASGVNYIASVADDFGIVKNAQAQESGKSGADQLKQLESIWKASRNLTYMLFVLIFIIIGFGIMLRLKIDPRTVMSIQNQIPKIVIAILLITFSYAIIGFMIDAMWLTTYVGINLLAPTTDVMNCDPDLSLQKATYSNLMDYPLAFANGVFKVNGTGVVEECNQGIASVSGGVGEAMGSIVKTLVETVITSGQTGACRDVITTFDSCVTTALSNTVGFFAGILTKLIAVIALIVVLFRLWIVLLKAYAYTILYTVLAPLWILAGLLPGSSTNFSSWFRSVVAKLAVFPAAAMFILIARIILDIYGKPNIGQNLGENFVPPLLGNPHITVFGPVLAFAILLICPEVLNMIDGALKAPQGKMGEAASKGFMSGTALPGAVAGAVSGRLMARDAKSGQGTGTVSAAIDTFAGGSGNRFKALRAGVGRLAGAPNRRQLNIAEGRRANEDRKTTP